MHGGAGDREPSSDGDAIVAGFARWAAEQRLSDAADERRRERWLRRQAGEAATFEGLLVDLAESHAEVRLGATHGSWAGRLAGVGRDFCIIEESRRGTVLIATGSLVSAGPVIGTLRSDLPVDVPGGDRRAPLAMDLAEALAVLAAERSQVILGCTDATTTSGTLTAVGADVVTLRSPTTDRRLVHLRLAAVESCAIR